MKKSLLFILLFLLVTYKSFSQQPEPDKPTNKNFNELKLNALFLIIGALEATYERSINEESGAGVSVFLPVSEDVDDISFYISPYYRFYFGKKYAAGFFVEGFGMLNSTESYFYDSNSNNYQSFKNNKKNTDFAIGFGLGGKWITKKGFLFEISSGVGRNLFNNKDTDFKIIGKGGINVGYRF